MQASTSESNVETSTSPETPRHHHHKFGFLANHHHRHPRTSEEHGDGSPRRARLTPRRLLSLGNEKDVQDWHAGRQSPKSPVAYRNRRTSTPLQALSHHDGELSAARRASASGGAKPVAPSWHPNAPEGLKVDSPEGAVLLPELPLAGMASNKEPIQVLEERVAQSSIDPPKMETDKVIRSETVKLQRPAIKVRIVTWNQGNSVPKGDLGVLLGRVGEYIAPEADWDESDDDVEGDEEAREQSRNSKASDQKKHRGMGVAGQEGIPRKDRIPPLPHDDAHPYHVVIVAGQECPWGDGKRIATGVGLAGELGDLGRSKSRAAAVKKEMKAKERGKDKEGRKGVGEDVGADVEEESELNRNHDGSEAPKTPGVIVTQEEDPFTTALPLTPGGVVKARSGGRGWSEMCEDWLCRGPLAQATATKGLAIASSAVSNPPSGLQSPQAGQSPAITRSPSPLPPALDDEMMKIALGSSSDHSDGGAETPNKRVSLVVPKRVLHKISRARVNSAEGLKLAQSPSLGSSELLLSGDNMASLPSSSPPSRPGSPMRHSYSAQSFLQRGERKIAAGEEEDGDAKKAAHHRLAIRIPGLSGTHHVTVQSDGTPSSIGAYELVCKERCYMMYMAVYVWRGCLDRVRGCSQGHVKSGLLAGRVGNKGAVGISLKLGQSRLLFVNAHLAAHEGKVAERIANVEKIKKELKVDTFLSKDDPRNATDDITACFDYAFWFGDLNFRVDITRRHADWLMMKKQYEHALAFDQLRKVMKEQPNIFYKFKEAAITFPPTFKYDVLKTIKQKKQSDERRAKQVDAIVRSEADDADRSIDTVGAADESTLRIDRDDDRSSISSAVNMSSQGHTSDPDETSNPTSPESTLDPALARDDVVAVNTAAAERIGMHGKAIKMRNRLMHVVHSAVGAVANAREDAPVPDGNAIDAKKKSRLSSTNIAADRSLPDKATSTDMVKGPSSSSLHPSTSIESQVAERSLRNSSSITDLSPHFSQKDKGQPSVDDETSDQAMQLYDTSAKQRVPSWCDRVLWRSNIDVVEDNPTDQSGAQVDGKGGAEPIPSRISVKLSNALARLHAKAEGPPVPPKDRQSSRSRSQREYRLSLSGQAGDEKRRAAPERSRWYSKRTYSLDATEKSIPRHKTMPNGSNAIAELPRIADLTHRTADPPRPGMINRSESADAALQGSSDSQADVLHASTDAAVRDSSIRGPPLPSPGGRRTSFNVDWTRLRSMNGSPSPLSGVGNGTKDQDPMDREAKGNVISSRKGGIANAHNSSARSSRRLSRSSTMQPGSVPAEQPTRRTSRWTELLSHLAPLLVPQTSVANAFANLGLRSDTNDQQTVMEKDALVGPKCGQVECMLYKSLNDREMRLLEGRSDHRPVVFVGAIGVGKAKDVSDVVQV